MFFGRQAPGFREKQLFPFSEYKTLFCYKENGVGSSECWYLSILNFGTCLSNYNVGTVYQTVILATLYQTTSLVLVFQIIMLVPLYKNVILVLAYQPISYHVTEKSNFHM